jgi:hypothetical protein
MVSRILMVALIATFSVVSASGPKPASAAEPESDRISVLAKCPTWFWQASPIPNVGYELCFDDVDHCTPAEIGDSVCIPSLGDHDVWVTAIDGQSATPIYYDGDVAPIQRVRDADFDQSGLVGFPDIFVFLNELGKTGFNRSDLNGDRVVNLADFFVLLDGFGRCINEAGSLYEAC